MILQGFRDISGANISEENETLIKCYHHVTLFQTLLVISLSLFTIFINSMAVISLLSWVKQKKTGYSQPNPGGSDDIADCTDKSHQPDKFDNFSLVCTLLLNIIHASLVAITNAVNLLTGPGLSLEDFPAFLMFDSLSLGKSILTYNEIKFKFRSIFQLKFYI